MKDNVVNVKIKLLNENAVIPRYAKSGDAGMDLTATSCTYDYKSKCWVYGTGIAVEIPKNHVGLLFPRSSSREKECYMANCIGVIDSGYRGEIMASFKDRTEYRIEAPYKVGDRVAQLIIIPYPTVNFILSDNLSESDRGAGGHGSTGK